MGAPDRQLPVRQWRRCIWGMVAGFGAPSVLADYDVGLCHVSDANTAEPVVRRRTSNWRRPICPNPHENVRRESRITQLAFTLLGGRDGAVAFLNSFDLALGETPLHVASASAAGYSIAHAQLLRRARLPHGDPK